MSYADIPAQWIQHHPVLAFLIACAVSIFSGDIRRFIKIPPQRLNLWILKTRISSTEDRLNRLKLLHENVQELIIVFAEKLFSGVLGWFMLYLLASEVSYFQWEGPGALVGSTILLMLIAAALTFSQFWTAFSVAYDLHHFDEESNRMGTRLTRLRSKIPIAS